MPAISKNARLKIKRANSHIDVIIRDSARLPENLYQITNGPGQSQAILTKPDGFYLSYRPKEPIKEHFAAIVGDVINNLREALDYWANAALIALKHPQKIHFPFSEKWEGLEGSSSYRTIKKALPDLADFILKEIKPCRDTNLNLWAATNLGNQNKHNDFVPTVTLLQLEGANLRIGGNRFGNLSVHGDADRPVIIAKSATPIAMSQNFSVTARVTFPKGSIFEDQSVGPTLANMSEVVLQTIDALDRFIVPRL